MYSPAQFLRQMKEFSGANISPQSIEEIESVLENNESSHDETWLNMLKMQTDMTGYRSERRDSLMMQKGSKQLFYQELRKAYRKIIVDKDGFDFLVHTVDGVIAYTVRYYSSIGSFVRNFAARGPHIRGYAEQAQGRIQKFRLIIIFDEDELELSDHSELKTLSDRVETNMEMYPIDNVTIGYLDVSGFNLFLEFGANV